MTRHIKSILFAAFIILPCVVSAAPVANSGNAYQFYLRSLLLESQGNLPGAKEELDKAIELAPASAYLYRAASELALRLGQVSEAAEHIEKTIQLDPNDVKALVLAGQIQWALGNADKAEKYLKRAVALDPDETEALTSLAGALTQKDPKQAIKLYEEFLVRHPGEVGIRERLAQLYQAIGDSAKARKAWEQTLEWAPTSLRAHLSLAQIAEVNFDTATAISHYEMVMAQDPNNLPLLLRVGELRYRNNELSKAFDAFSKAQSIAPDSATANFWLALLAESRGDWKEAVRLLEQVSNNLPDAGVYLRLSYYYSQVGDYAKAVSTLKKLHEMEPANVDFLTYLAIAYEQNKQRDQAEKVLLQIVALSPNDPEAYFQLGSLYDRMGKFDKAEENLKRAIILKPNYDMALNYLGYSYADRNINLDEAEKMLNMAVALDPDNPAYLDSIGWVYFRLGKLKKAEDFLREATLKARDTLIWEHLGDVQVADENLNEAVLSYDESLRISPKNKSVQAKIKKAMTRLSKRERFDLFVKRAAANFGDNELVKGVVRVKVCESAPCFDGKAQFSYVRGAELKVEMPGPLTAPLVIFTKRANKPAEFGAVHPFFQQAEVPVTRALERVDSLITADLFRTLDLTLMEQNVSEKNGRLIGENDQVILEFKESSGELAVVQWKDFEGTEVLTVKPGTAGKKEVIFPSALEWKNLQSKSRVDFHFLDPVVAQSPRRETATTK